MSNPTRGCGTKKPNSFYIEGEMSAGGGLHALTWLFGDGVENFIPLNIPPRQIQFANIPATIARGSLVLNEGKYQPSDWERDIYKHLASSAVPPIGIVDHVGKNNYSAYSFATEVGLYGPSRKITPQMATIVGELIHKTGPLPIMFTHDRVPTFTTSKEVDDAIQMALGCFLFDYKNLAYNPVWEYGSWGMYAIKNQWTGAHNPRHFMHVLLPVIDQIDKHWKDRKDNEAYQAAKTFFAGTRMIEQPFALSWLTKVTYTLPEDGIIPDKVQQILQSIPNVNILDLQEEENVE